MNMKNGWNSFKGFFVRLGKKNLIIVGAVVLIGAAVWLNFIFFSSGSSKGDGNAYGASAGMSSNYGTEHTTKEVGTEASGADASTEAYFSAVQVSRQRARDEALEVLNAVVSNEKADDAVKANALSEITKISQEMRKESDIETLIQSKGYSRCLAVINGDSANIVVACESGKLESAQLAQINAIVYEQAGIAPTNITISAKKG